MGALFLSTALFSDQGRTRQMTSFSLVWIPKLSDDLTPHVFLQVFVRDDAPSSVFIVFDTENRIFGLPRELVITVAGTVFFCFFFIKALSFAFCTSLWQRLCTELGKQPAGLSCLLLSLLNTLLSLQTHPTALGSAW